MKNKPRNMLAVSVASDSMPAIRMKTMAARAKQNTTILARRNLSSPGISTSLLSVINSLESDYDPYPRAGLLT